jgi:hypothetical protein
MIRFLSSQGALMAAATLLSVAACGERHGSRMPVAEENLPAPSPADGNTWVRQMETRYSSCTSYRDSGTLRTKLYRVGDAKPLRSAATFRTAFGRACAGFYFESCEMPERFGPPIRLAVWRDPPNSARRWASYKPAEVNDSDLDDALGVFAGTSHGLLSLVPRLLLGESSSDPVPVYKVVSRALLDGVSVVQISEDATERHTDLWLRESDAALVRLSDRRVVPKVRPDDLTPKVRALLAPDTNEAPLISEREIEIFPVFDEPTHDSDFRFAPPTPPSTDSAALK